MMKGEMPMLVHRVLQEAVRKFPDKPFLYYEDGEITYRQLDAVSDRLADAFLKMGISRGDNIALVALNQPEWLYTYFAAAKIGAAIVTLNVRYRMAEFDYMLNNSRSMVLVCLRKFGEFDYSLFFREHREKFPTVKKYIFLGGGFEGSIAFEDLLANGAMDEENLAESKQHVKESDTTVIIYTSGTTGRPKGAMITNRSILASARAEAAHFGLDEHEIVLGHLPFNHVGGITCTIAVALVTGASVVLVPSFRPDLALEYTEKYRVTLLGGVPTMYVMMLDHSNKKPYDLSSVTRCIAGGSVVEPRLCRKIGDFFPNARVLNLYGLSETSGACVLSRPDDSVAKVGESIGVTIGNFQVKVVDGDKNELPTGETGELAFKGDCVVSGYYGLKTETLDAFTDRWIFTGDMGYVDEEGYIYLKGRKKEMYIQGGFNVYPVEIENLLADHPKVSMAAGIGVPDPVFGEVGRFYIVPRPGQSLTEEEILLYCRQNLADYKVPKQMVITNELPLTPVGKIHKALLKKQYLSRMTGDDS